MNLGAASSAFCLSSLLTLAFLAPAQASELPPDAEALASSAAEVCPLGWLDKAVEGTKKGVDKAADGVKKGADKAEEGVKKGAEKGSEGVKKGADKTQEGVKKGAEKVKDA